MVPEPTSKNTINFSFTVAKEGNVSGRVRIQKTDYEALKFRKNYSGINKEKYVEALENEFSGIEIKNYQLENETNLSSPIQETFDFVSSSHSEAIGDNLYVYPLLFFTPQKNPFHAER